MIKLYPMPISIKENDGTYRFSYVNIKGIENEIIIREYADRGITLSDGEPNVIYTKKSDLMNKATSL